MIEKLSLGVIHGHKSSVTGWCLKESWLGTAQQAKAGGEIKEPQRDA